jgi:fatty acid desaturase
VISALLDDGLDSMRALSETDDVRAPSRWFARLDDGIAPWLIHAQDAPAIRRTSALGLVCGLGLYGNFHFSWEVVDIFYLGLILYGNALGAFLHMMSHRKIFVRSVDWLNRMPIWALSVWFGEPPYFFATEHVASHHSYNNAPEDLSCTLSYQRDSLWDFGRYLLNFFLGTGGILGLIRMFAQGRGGRTWRRRFLSGQMLFWGFVALRLWQDWVPTSMLLLGPFFVVNIMNRANNWTEHAFIDPRRPLDIFGNSYSIVDSDFNRNSCNEGYHATHHLKPGAPNFLWPRLFRDNLAMFCDADHLVFKNISSNRLFVLLMMRNYRAIASHCVQFPGALRSETELIEMLRARVARRDLAQNSAMVAVV